MNFNLNIVVGVTEAGEKVNCEDLDGSAPCEFSLRPVCVIPC